MNHTDQNKHERGQLQHDAEHAKPRKRLSVLGYLVILFAAAFLLLLMTYFQQQRANEETISGLKSSVSAMQSIEDLMANNDSLQQQVSDLENQLAQAKNETERGKQALEAEKNALTQQIQAMDYLRRIQQFYYAGSYRSARAVVEKFEAAGLKGSLPTETTYQNEEHTVLSPAEEYQKIYDALY